MPTRRFATAAFGSLMALSLVVSCSDDGTPRAKLAPQFPDAFKPAPAGGYHIVAAVPPPSEPPDERSRLLAPVQVLPAEDGGLIVVTQNDISTLTAITRNGSLKSHLLAKFPTYADGTSPTAATSVLPEKDDSLVAITRTGEIVRMTGKSVVRLGRLPKRTGGTLIPEPNGRVIVQQGINVYHATLEANKVTIKPFTVNGAPKRYALQAVTRNVSFLSDGKAVLAITTSNKKIFNKMIKSDSSISSITPDGDGGAWAGDNDGGITHISASGTVSQVNQGNPIAGDCTSRGKRAPLGAVYSMLLRESQLYAVDKLCNIIVSFGVR